MQIEAVKEDLRSHPQQRAEIVASVADIDNLFEIVHLFPVLLQPVLQFVALAHVDQASNLTRVLIRRVGGDPSANQETVSVLLGPMRRVGDDSMEKRSQIMFLRRRCQRIESRATENAASTFKIVSM